MRVLVVGGTHFIGPHAVRELVARGCDVTVFHRGEHEADLPATVRHAHGDRARAGDLEAAVRDVRPDVVLDTAPMIEAHAVAVADAARGVARRVVAVSSADVYRAYGRLHGTEPGPPEPMPLREDAPLREKLYPYRGSALDAPWRDDYDKIPIERRVLGDAGFAGTILRLGFVHGPGTYRYYELARRMFDGRPAILIGEGVAGLRGTRADVADVGRAIALAVSSERAAGRVYNVGEPGGTSEIDLARVLAEVAGWSGEIRTVAADDVPERLRERLPGWTWAREAHDLVLDTSRIRTELGYAESAAPRDGLRRAVAWMREHPPTADLPVIRGGFDYAAEDELLALMRYRSRS